ncbi:MAG: hypothetical protein EPO26_04470 [Chloroflexota bacterium]|nr:MAG: hypothetical protein EPO26_04470 [Chloroflexota bacterium]
MNVKQTVGLVTAGVVAATAIALVGVRKRLTSIGASAAGLPRGEAHMWGIIAGVEQAEQVAG